VPVLVEVAKNACTMGILLCLDRKQSLESRRDGTARSSEVWAASARDGRRETHSHLRNIPSLTNTSTTTTQPMNGRRVLMSAPLVSM
jgi:hypothetical protein